MPKRWKLKTNSSNILLVLITLILVTAEWTKGQSLGAEDPGNSVEAQGDPSGPVQMYVGNDEISHFFFRSSAANNSRVLEDVNRCLDNFQLVTCLKMLLLDRINGLVSLLEDPSVDRKDFRLAGGLVVFERKSGPENRVSGGQNESLSLDEEISVKVLRMFRNRCLRFNLLNVKIEIEPTPTKTKDGFVCFSYKILREEKSSKDDDYEMEQGRKKGKKGKGGMSMMMLPQLLMLGFMPFTLASLKAMVMNAVMINMMALNGAIFMTIRNLVFGPRSGDNVKYVNYGYSKDRQTQSRRPVLIIHSPAAFVKQPKVHGKRQPAYSGLGYFPTGHSATHNREYVVQGSEPDFDGDGQRQAQLGWNFQDQNQKHHIQHPPHQVHKPNHASPHRNSPADIEVVRHESISIHHHQKPHRQKQPLQSQQQMQQQQQQWQRQQQQQQQQRQQQPQKQQQQLQRQQQRQQQQWQRQQQQQQAEQSVYNSKNKNNTNPYSGKSKATRLVASPPQRSSGTEPEESRQERNTQREDSNEETNLGSRWDPIHPNSFRLETSSSNKSEKYSP